MSKITITVEIEVEEGTARAIKANPKVLIHTLSDALSEFASDRGAGYEEGYVNKRYSKRFDEPWFDKDEKIAEVTRRNKLALALKSGSFRARIAHHDLCYHDWTTLVDYRSCDKCDAYEFFEEE